MKGNKFHDFLFASLNDKSLSKMGSALSPIALKTEKTPESFGRSECNMVKGAFFFL